MLYCKGTVCWFGCKANWGRVFQEDDEDGDFNNLTLAFTS